MERQKKILVAQLCWLLERIVLRELKENGLIKKLHVAEKHRDAYKQTSQHRKAKYRRMKAEFEKKIRKLEKKLQAIANLLTRASVSYDDWQIRISSILKSFKKMLRIAPLTEEQKRLIFATPAERETDGMLSRLYYRLFPRKKENK